MKDLVLSVFLSLVFFHISFTEANIPSHKIFIQLDDSKPIDEKTSQRFREIGQDLDERYDMLYEVRYEQARRSYQMGYLEDTVLILIILGRYMNYPPAQFSIYRMLSLEEEIGQKFGDPDWLQKLRDLPDRSGMSNYRLKNTARDSPLSLLKIAANEQGLSIAQYYLALERLKAGEFNEAFQLFEVLSEQGIAPAMYYQALMLLRGEGTEKDPDRALQLLEVAAEQGNAFAKGVLEQGLTAQSELPEYKYDESNQSVFLNLPKSWRMERLLKGESLETLDQDLFITRYYLALERLKAGDFNKAFQLFESFSEHRAISLYYQGLMLLRGEGIERDLDESFQLLEAAAEQGNVFAKEVLEQNLIVQIREAVAEQGYAFVKKVLDHDLSAQSELPEYEYEELSESISQDLRRLWMERFLAGQLQEVTVEYPGYEFLNRSDQLWINIASEERTERTLVQRALEKGMSDFQYRTFHEGRDKHMDNDRHWPIKTHWVTNREMSSRIYDRALRYYKGDGFDKDIEMAIYWFSETADMGYAPAEYILALLLEELAEGKDPGSKIREYLLDRSLQRLIRAAEQGYTPAKYKLAHRYQEEDPDLAFQLLKEVAEIGNTDVNERETILVRAAANYELYYEFLKRGDPIRAYASLVKASELGLPFATYEQAYLYKEKDPQEFVQLLEKAAEQGSPLALYDLAGLYDRGEIVGEDPDKAMRLFQEAADMGNASAQYKLYFKFMFGSHEVAVQWLKRSAEQNHPGALYELGTLYENGRVNGKGINEAVLLFMKSAEQEYPPALGRIVDVLCGNYGEIDEDVFYAIRNWAVEERGKGTFDLECLDDVSNNGTAMLGIGTGLLAAEGVRQAISGSGSTAEASSPAGVDSARAVSHSEGSDVEMSGEVLTADVPVDQISEATLEPGKELVTEVTAGIVEEIAWDVAMSAVPFVGVLPASYEVISGKHALSGRELETWERWASAGGGVLSLFGFGLLKNAKHVKHVGLVWDPVKNAGSWLVKLSDDQWSRFVSLMKGGQVEESEGVYGFSVVFSGWRNRV